LVKADDALIRERFKALKFQTFQTQIKNLLPFVLQSILLYQFYTFFARGILKKTGL